MWYFAQGHRQSSPLLHSKGAQALESSQHRVTLSPSSAVWLSSSLVKTTGAAEERKAKRSYSFIRCGVKDGNEKASFSERKVEEWKDEGGMRRWAWSSSYPSLPEILSSLRRLSGRSSFPSLPLTRRWSAAHKWLLFLPCDTFPRAWGSIPALFSTQRGVQALKVHSEERQWLPPQLPGFQGLEWPWWEVLRIKLEQLQWGEFL